MVRKNVTPEVATPRSSKRDVFCTVRISTCMHRPMPVPRMNRYSDCSTNGVVASMRDSSRKPTTMIAVPMTGKILYRPVRPTRAPLPVEVMSRPATMGRVRKPDSVADTPSTNCMNVGRNVSAPSIAKPTMNDSTQHTVNTGLRNRRIGRIGSAARVSARTNSTSAVIEPMNRPMIIGEVHAYSPPPQLVASVRPDAPRPTNRIPT